MSNMPYNACASLLRMVRKRLPSPATRMLASRYRIGGEFRRIYHFHIRKTAGTSLDAAFWHLAGIGLEDFGTRSQVRNKGLILVRGERKKIENGAYYYASSHIPAHVLKLPADTFTITLLRDPLDRLLSYYRYLLWAKHDPQAPAREPFLAELQPEIACLGSSLAEFLERADTNNILSQLYMFSRDYEIGEARDRILACSAVGFTEHFDRFLDALSRRLDLPLAICHERRFKHEISPAPADLRRAREMLAPEYALLREVQREMDIDPERVAPSVAGVEMS